MTRGGGGGWEGRVDGALPVPAFWSQAVPGGEAPRAQTKPPKRLIAYWTESKWPAQLRGGHPHPPAGPSFGDREAGRRSPPLSHLQALQAGQHHQEHTVQAAPGPLG